MEKQEYKAGEVVVKAINYIEAIAELKKLGLKGLVEITKEEGFYTLRGWVNLG